MKWTFRPLSPTEDRTLTTWPMRGSTSARINIKVIMIRALRFSGLVLLNLAVALFGTAILEASIAKLVPTHSLSAILWKVWILSVTCAALIGFGMWRTWRSGAAKWTWVLPMLWFAIRVVPAAVASTGLWFQFSGAGCQQGVHSLDCRNFFVFTVPFIRGAAYSLGAYLSSFVYRPSTASELADSSAVSG